VHKGFKLFIESTSPERIHEQYLNKYDHE